ncbi:MAG: class I SAM-dependent methyltransferase [bacterium]
MSFQDHFSRQADAYARYRPRYPQGLYRYLAGLCLRRNLAWDCATGNGQAALGLAPYFSQVIATDASERQIAQAEAHPGVEYRVAPAEASGLPGRSVDLITVAQAFHWFEFEKFYAEVRRVAVPQGIIALWGYQHFSCSPEIDRVYLRYYSETVGPYWPADRRWVEERYQGIPFPFPELEAPEFSMTLRWNLEDLLGYLGTWSATQRYREAMGRDPLPELRNKLAPLWGDPEQAREIRWPLFLRVGRVI